MSWQDGSRFLIASGVKWGTGPKMYKGSSTDTTWNNDLLWKLYVEQEARKTGIQLSKGPDDVEHVPPIMKPVAAATNKGFQKIPFRDPFARDPSKTCQPHHSMESDRSSPLRRLQYLKAFPEEAAKLGPPRRREAVMLNTGRRSLDKSASSPGLPPASARSTRSRVSSVARASARSATSRRLANIEKMLTQERAAREDLSASLSEERKRREQVEGELAAFKAKMVQSLTQTKNVEGKLAQYKEIMDGLAQTMKKADAKRTARSGRR